MLNSLTKYSNKTKQTTKKTSYDKSVTHEDMKANIYAMFRNKVNLFSLSTLHVMVLDNCNRWVGIQKVSIDHISKNF